MKILFFLLINILLYGKIITYEIQPHSIDSINSLGIKILDSKELSFKSQGVNELSALAYKNKKLYALSNLGYLYHFKLTILNDKINKLELLKRIKLKNKKGKRLKKKKSDSEGMVLVGDRLYISFERKPRVSIYSFNGEKIKKYKIQKCLREIKNYQGKNKALESIAYNVKYGVLVAPELELIGDDNKYHTIYSKKQIYKFIASGNLTDLEFISDDKIMALEREFNMFTRRMIITITEIDLSRCKDNICKSKLLANLDSDDGWRLDNFEGITKIDKNRYLMVSDDNRNFLQKTLLVLFKIN